MSNIVRHTTAKPLTTFVHGAVHHTTYTYCLVRTSCVPNAVTLSPWGWTIWAKHMKFWSPWWQCILQCTIRHKVWHGLSKNVEILSYPNPLWYPQVLSWIHIISYLWYRLHVTVISQASAPVWCALRPHEFRSLDTQVLPPKMEKHRNVVRQVRKCIQGKAVLYVRNILRRISGTSRIMAEWSQQSGSRCFHYGRSFLVSYTLTEFWHRHWISALFDIQLHQNHAAWDVRRSTCSSVECTCESCLNHV